MAGLLSSCVPLQNVLSDHMRTRLSLHQQDGSRMVGPGPYHFGALAHQGAEPSPGPFYDCFILNVELANFLDGFIPLAVYIRSLELKPPEARADSCIPHGVSGRDVTAARSAATDRGQVLVAPVSGRTHDFLSKGAPITQVRARTESWCYHQHSGPERGVSLSFKGHCPALLSSRPHLDRACHSSVPAISSCKGTLQKP